MRRVAWALALAACAIAACSRAGNESGAHWLDLKDHRLYYEIRGSGKPLLMLHGGGGSPALSFPAQMAPLSACFRLILPEQIGQGRTPDFGNRLSYAQMTEDTARLIEQLRLGPVDIVGFSDGGILALMLALRHPALVGHVIASGANVTPDGLESGLIQSLKAPGLIFSRAEAEAYAASNPDGRAHLPIISNKLKQLWLDSPRPDEISLQALAHLDRPVLLLSGDHDLIRLEHTVAMQRALPQSHLLVLPNTGHDTFSGQPAVVNAAILGFLAQNAAPDCAQQAESTTTPR